MDQKIKNSIVNYLHITHLSSSEQEEVIAGLEENVRHKMNLSIIERLSIEEQEKIVHMVNPGDVFDFLQEKMENLKNFIEDCARSTIEEFLQIRSSLVVQI